jgi:hypothetical protein
MTTGAHVLQMASAVMGYVCDVMWVHVIQSQLASLCVGSATMLYITNTIYIYILYNVFLVHVQGIYCICCMWKIHELLMC